MNMTKLFVTAILTGALSFAAGTAGDGQSTQRGNDALAALGSGYGFAGHAAASGDTNSKGGSAEGSMSGSMGGMSGGMSGDFGGDMGGMSGGMSGGMGGF